MISKTKNLKTIGRMGAKDNDIKHFKEYLPMDVKDVVEPFGGSYAICRCVYKGDEYKKYVNDNDPFIIEAFKNPEELKEKYEEYNKFASNPDLTGEKIKEYKLQQKSVIEMGIMEEGIVRGFIVNKKPNIDEGIEFMKKIIFTSEDAFSTIEKHRKNPNAFIFLDPPYMFSNNKNYKQQEIDADNTDYLYKMFEIFEDATTTAKIMIVINELKIIKYLFKKYRTMTYGKCYSMSKKRDTHLVIMNY